MQNLQTIIELGFQQTPAGWLFRGKHQKFIAVEGYDKRFITLYLVHPEIDRRLLSPNKGRHYLSRIKDCCSNESVKRAVEKFDLLEDRIIRSWSITIKE